MTTVAPEKVSVLVRRPGPQELHPPRTHRRRRALELSLAVAVPLLLALLWQLAATHAWLDDRVDSVNRTLYEEAVGHRP
ncbi:hypothetical protein ACIRP7_18580 [Streptomyces sp. NPDC102270]|uniref:hypothetical protein n=1 Tax=Streptomyces sp. NPDC102270 TaxID=3366150 RepID=UPI003809EA4D